MDDGRVLHERHESANCGNLLARLPPWPRRTFCGSRLRPAALAWLQPPNAVWLSAHGVNSMSSGTFRQQNSENFIIDIPFISGNIRHLHAIVML